MEILHLEDDGPLREIMHIALSAADPNMNVVQFTDSDEAITYIAENWQHINLFVLDVRVPGELDGLGVAEKIREYGSTQPILVTSAYRKPDQDRMEASNCHWMAKPWHLLDAPQKILGLATGEVTRIPSPQTQPKRSEAMRPVARSKSRTLENPPTAADEVPVPDVSDVDDLSETGTGELQTILGADSTQLEIIELDDPIPFDNDGDNDLALGNDDGEQTDLMIAIARKQEELSAQVHKSHDAPTVEPYVEDNEDL